MTAIGDQATHGPIECSARGEEHDGCGDSRLRKACAVSRAVVLRLERRRWSSCCRRCDEERDVCRDGTADGVAHSVMYSEMHYCCQRRGDPDPQCTRRSNFPRFIPIYPTMNKIILIA